MFNVIFLMLLGSTAPDVEALIVKLKPNINARTKTMIAETVVEYAPKAGLANDIKLILAVAFTESGFSHKRIPGAAGELGMMQVIPGDPHIRQAASRYVCLPEEDRWVRDEEGYFRVCTGTKPNLRRLDRFIKASPRGGIAIGIYELAFWRSEYEAKYKARFWDRPAPLAFRRWHNQVKEGLGDWVWVCHYNYGGHLRTSPTARAYPMQIIKNLKQL